MAPPAKRKRPERNYTQDGDFNGRPSPHRPHNMNLAQQNQYNNSPAGGGRGERGERGATRGGRRESRGGAGTGGGRRAPASHASLQRSENAPASPTVSRPHQQAQSGPQSRPATPAEKTNTDRPSAPAVSSAAKPPIKFTYQYLTDDHKNAWKTSGKKAVLDAAIQAQEGGDILALSVIFQELVEAGIGGRIDSTEAGQVVRDLLAHAGDQAHDTASFFLDSLSVLAEVDAESPALKFIIAAAEIPPTMVREELDVPLLTTLGIVRNTFFKMGTRHATNQLYRQSNYNLLREESEGYSKLMTEYFTITNSEPPSGETAADTFQRVKALIGAFDLDVGRVLDVTLDVFANLLVKHYRFFIKFLRVSSWWPEEKGLKGLEWTTMGLESLPRWALPDCSGWTLSEQDKEELAQAREERDQAFWSRLKEVGFEAFFELGARRITSGEVTLEDSEAEKNANGEAKQRKPEDITEAEFNREWISHTKTLPPAGNRVAAQLLGFKLRFYASSARDPHDVLPDNLIFLAALLIKVGFISLRDLYPHLYPLDKDMPQVKVTLLKEKEEREKKARGGGTLNALAMAGALADDTAPLPLGASRLREMETSRSTSAKPEEKAGTPKPEEEEKEKLPEPADQKIALLKSLLCIGAIPESLYILGKFPWLPDVHPELPEYLHRILNHSISKVYDTLRPLSDREGIRPSKRPISSEPGAAKGDLRFAESQPRKVLRWAQLDRNGSNDNEIDYRFYWDDWADNVPVCQNVDDIFALCGSLLNLTGIKIGQDPALLTKLARIGKWSLSDDKSEENFKRWADLSKRLLVPALSLTKSNPGVVNEIWDLLKLYPTATRYNIYAEWYTGQTSRTEDIKSAFAQSQAETKDVLKRISKTNTKQQARALAKVAYSSPGIVFRVALNQIESYDNLVEVIVECARYFTYLGYDVLTWSLMNSLGGKGRDRVQADGMLTSRWLQALSLFAGRVFKRYSIMNPTPILQYVTHQLRAGNSTDLEVLEQILSQMAGIPADAVFNENQTLAMAGGEVLQAQTLEQIHDQRHQHKNFAKRLLKALVEPGLAGQLLVAIAQERQLYPHRESVSDAPLKVLGTNLDKFHQVFTQYLDVLRTNMTPKEFDAAIPDIVSLMAEFGIEPQTAFAVGRPSLSQAISEADAAIAAEKAKEEQERRESVGTEKAATNGDVEMGEASDDKEAGETNDDMQEESKEEIVKKEPTGTSTAAPTATIPEEPWHPVLKELIDRMKPTLPEDFEQKMSLAFYTSFWQLSLNDMHVPTQSYELEIKRQQEKISSIIADRSDVSVAGIKKRDDKKKAIMDLQDRLRSEMKNQISTYQTCRGRLSKEKNHWFATHPLAFGAQLHDNIIQECFLPRLVLSPFDAQYTFKMLFFLHSTGTPGFKTMYLIDRLMREKLLSNLIFMSTAREVENLGRFLNELLKELRRWHASQEVYEKHAFGAKRDLPGFARKMAQDKTPEVFLTYEEYRRLMYKWHMNLNNALKACFTGGEYMHIRNAIIILKAVHQNFPVINFQGKTQLECVITLSKTETREDLKLAATSLIGDLKKRESSWLLPQAFRLNDHTPGQKPTSRQGTEGPATPKTDHSQVSSTKLDGAAPEFKPGEATNGTIPNGTANGKADAEDGMNKQKTQQLPGPAKVTTSTTGDQEGRKPDDTKSNQSDKDKSSESRPPTPAYGQLPHRSDSKPATPVPSASGSSMPRPDLHRTASQPTLRQPHALPNRPDTQIARGRVVSDRPADPHPRRGDGRGPPPSDYGRLERPGDVTRDFPDRSREQSTGHRRASRSPAPAHIDRDRRGEPQWQSGREAWEHPEDRSRAPPRDARQSVRAPPQWTEPPSRRPPFDTSENQRGRPPFEQQGQPSDGWNRHPGTMPPPSSSGPYPHPDRAGRLGERAHAGAQLPDRPPSTVDRSGINPERAALIERDLSMSDGRRGRSSRPHSPTRRSVEERPVYQPRDDYRDDRPHPNQERMPPTYPPPRERREDPNSIPPTGPRGDRGGRNEFSGPPPSRGGRELFEPTPTRPPSDPNHGRLNQDFPRPSDPSYGRLNPPDVPSGPRGRGAASRGVRSSAPDSRPSPSIPQSPHNERGPPSGPTADRRGDQRGDQRGDFSNDHGSSPADMVGVHPSRLGQIPGARNEMPAPSASSSFPPPAGPRGRTSVTSPTTGRPAPTGPASNDKDKRFAHLANVLSQGSASGGYSRGDSDRGASIRGRANRPGSTNSPTHSQPSTPMPSNYDNQVGGSRGMDPRGSERGDLVSSNMPDDHRMDQHRSSSRREHRRSGVENTSAPGSEQSGMHRRSMRHRSTSPPGSSSMGGMRESRDSGRSSRTEDRRSGGHGHSHGHSSSHHHGGSSHDPPNGDVTGPTGGSSGQIRGSSGRDRRGEGRESRGSGERGGERDDGRSGARSERKRPRGDGVTGEGESKRPRRNTRGDGER
ncbi:transcription factor/nuclear export subunit protein 2-domain-containing protein [Phyllosticta citrichinensis]|uniref:THO complex subunit 2 n=1 Tax=Phyllosticta citrichinensis TaxID=1130410 RepID=A0ABR1XXZ7_9PEZI